MLDIVVLPVQFAADIDTRCEVFFYGRAVKSFVFGLQVWIVEPPSTFTHIGSPDEPASHQGATLEEKTCSRRKNADQQRHFVDLRIFTDNACL